MDKLVNVLRFRQSTVDEYLFYRGKTLFALYTYASILEGKYSKEVDQIIKDTKKVKLDITIKGDPQDFLGVNIDRNSDGSIHLNQPHLIDHIIKDLLLEDEQVTTKPTP